MLLWIEKENLFKTWFLWLYACFVFVSCFWDAEASDWVLKSSRYSRMV